jgi:sugar (pentulose or hexulose) kinase
VLAGLFAACVAVGAFGDVVGSAVGVGSTEAGADALVGDGSGVSAALLVVPDPQAASVAAVAANRARAARRDAPARWVTMLVMVFPREEDGGWLMALTRGTRRSGCS